jgi:hypothetical protein
LIITGNHSGFGGYVDLVGFDAACAGRQQLFFRCSGLIDIACPDRDVAAELGDAHGETQADPAVTSRHQRDLARAIKQWCRHVSSLARFLSDWVKS